MKVQTVKQIAFTAGVIGIAVVSFPSRGTAQFNGQPISMPVISGNVNGFTGFNGGYGFGNPFPILYGGDNYTGQSVAVTPFGIREIGYGYNGYTGAGEQPGPDWQMLRAIYAQAYQDAFNTVTANSANAPNNDASVNPSEVAPPTGMTAAPRGFSGRVPHGNDDVRAWRVGGKQIALRWQGDPKIASSVTFELNDSSGKPLRRTTVSQLPAEVRFMPPANAAFYQVKVQYIDGATNTIMSRLPK
jgi:hypothetical protein